MRKVLILLVILGVISTGVDVVAKKAAEGQIAQRASASSGADASGHASITSFPFVVRLLTAGSVPRIEVRVDRPVAGGVTFDWIDVDLHGVHLDKQKLLSDRKAEITSISSGLVTVALGSAALTAITHTQVQVAHGQIAVTVAGKTVQATPSVDGHGELRLAVEPLPSLPFRLPSSRLLPCAATRVQVEGDVVKLACSFTQVPPALLRAAQAA